jgi:hypothetical protein
MFSNIKTLLYYINSNCSSLNGVIKKMDFKIDFGPWEKVFSGDFMGHKTQILSNSEKFFLIIIYELNEGGKEVGALFQGYKAMVVKGNLDSFITTIPKPILGITKSNGEKTKKMLFISFDPLYVDFKQEDFIRRVDNKIKHSYDEINTIIELARSSGVNLKDTSVSPKEDYAPILSDPMAARLLLGGLRKSSLELVDLPSTKPNDDKVKLTPVGLSKKREIIREESSSFYSTYITGESQNSINYASYILIENLLLDNNTTIIIDEDNYFSGLGTASNHENELREELVDFEPAGFPIKKFDAKNNLKVSLKNCEIKLLLDMFNVDDASLSNALKDFSFKENTIKEAIENIDSLENLTGFGKLKMERLLNIMDKNIGSVFGEPLDISELTKKWSGNLGRATIVNIHELSHGERVIFTHALLNYFKENIDNQNKTLIALPDASEYLRLHSEKIFDYVSYLETKGIGFIIGTRRKRSEFNDLSKAKIQVVNKKDVALSLKDKNYRVILRPSLSGEPKIE